MGSKVFDVVKPGVVTGDDVQAIFKIAKDAGFGSPERDPESWISIEDGVDGMDQLVRSVAFLRKKIAVYWPEF